MLSFMQFAVLYSLYLIADVFILCIIFDVSVEIPGVVNVNVLSYIFKYTDIWLKK
jgi:hypothetical protein